MTTKNGNGSGGGAAALRQSVLSQAGVLNEREATLPGADGPMKVLVRELTGQQSREFEEAVAKGTPAPLGFLLTMCLVDPESRELIFATTDREALEQLGMSAVKPIVEIAQELSGLSEADLAKAKAVLGRAPSRG